MNAARAALRALSRWSKTPKLLATLDEMSADWRRLPPTIFRCAVCGERVGRYDPPTGEGRQRFRMPTPDCPTHGPLQHPTVRSWYAEWTRRGRPARLNMRLPRVR